MLNRLIWIYKVVLEMVLTSQDREIMEVSLGSLRQANERLRALGLADSIRNVNNYGLYCSKKKMDTFLLDAVAEECIAEQHSEKSSLIYGIRGVVMSEERGMGCRSRVSDYTPVLLSDPVDGSRNLSKLVSDQIAAGGMENLGQLFDSYEEKLGDLARISAPVSALTFIKVGELKYSMVLNFFTGEIYVAYENGVMVGNINHALSVDSIDEEVNWRQDGKQLLTCNMRRESRCRNFEASHLNEFFRLDKSVSYFAGPSRFTYLLAGAEDLFPDLGVVCHNKEGIQEIISNIGVALYSGGRLKAYKLCCPEYEKPFFRGMIAETGVNSSVLEQLIYPGDYEDTTVVVPSSNTKAVVKMDEIVDKGYGMRLV